MLLSQIFLSFVLVAVSSVDASSLVHRDGGKGSLRFSRRFSLDVRASGLTLPETDRVRARSMKRASPLNKRSAIPESVRITNTGVNYVASVGIGNPQHNYTLLIDTGSSNTYVGVNQSNPYIRTKTSIDTGHHLNLTYGTGNVTGEEWLDTVTLGPGLVIKNQSIGALNFANGSFASVDGIIGVGPVDLTAKTVSNAYRVPTVMDNLYSQHKIKEEVLGIYFVPSSESNTAGELTFGGYDATVVTSPVTYVPLTTTKPASGYWGVNLTVSYGSQTLLPNNAGILDTGTTLILFATEVFKKYQSLTGAVMDNNTGLLAISSDQYAKLQILSFKIGGTSYDLTPNAQIWPRSLNAAIGGNSSAIYLVVSDLGTPVGSGLDFTNGFAWLERFYTVYDTTNQRAGVATTAYTTSTAN